MFSTRLKSCLKLFLPALGLALVPVASCAGTDPAPAVGSGGEPGGAGPSGSAEGGAGGAGSGNPIPCSCVMEGSGGAISLCPGGLATLEDICARLVAANDYLMLTNGACEPGTRLHHNMVYPATGAIPETEAPRSTDAQQIGDCVEYALNPTNSYPWESAVNDYLCVAEAVWACGGTWTSDNCGGVPLQQSCSQ